MPTYDYECDKCGHTFDEFQSMSDEPLKTCPTCGKNSLRRLIGGGLGIIFKGSGFYATDSRVSSGDHGSSGMNGNGQKEASSETAAKSTDSSSESSGSPSTSGSNSKAGDSGKKTESASKT